MRLVDVLEAEDIEALGQQVRAILDGGYVSRALADAVTGMLEGRSVRLSGCLDKYSFDISIWMEERK